MGDQFLQNYKQSFSLSDIDPNMDFFNQFSGLNPNLGFPHDISILSANLDTFPGLFIQDHTTVLNPFTKPLVSNDRKRKPTDVPTPESTSANTSAYSSPQVSDNGSKKTNRAPRGKKVKCNDREDEKPREVIHVRAKRGEATDSHSLAERVRRGKINERLRCLQDIVPGCYKTMGMAVMLDEIINYVQSLQNQVEFLSMKLTAASTFHDFNSDTDAVDAIHREKAFEALKPQNHVGSQQGSLPSAYFAQSGLNFGYCPQPPHSR